MFSPRMSDTEPNAVPPKDNADAMIPPIEDGDVVVPPKDVADVVDSMTEKRTGNQAAKARKKARQNQRKKDLLDEAEARRVDAENTQRRIDEAVHDEVHKQQALEAKEQRERDIERERKRVADENASLAAENERKKRKLDLARRGLSTSVSPRKEIDSVPGPSMADPTVSSTVPAVASSSSSPQKGVVGTRMTTGGKPPRKAVSKGKSARALEKERADDHGEDPVNSDIEMGANL
ncbi:hypothetical protein F5878DRAFT_667049 [Lentinula raphanica]|uniref:Uncharacterized protein n=1 Tax=Lentinula raphanica TaxID=153919 RepID=A0AA38NWN8_9AGAR|nr:hypothetical protein F5878DRAFT_667049 [Lentinula raphanica]